MTTQIYFVDARNAANDTASGAGPWSCGLGRYASGAAHVHRAAGSPYGQPQQQVIYAHPVSGWVSVVARACSVA